MCHCGVTVLYGIKTQPTIIVIHSIHCGPLKRATKLLSISLLNIDQFLKFFHCHTVWAICDRTFIKNFTTPKKRRYITSWNTSFQKLHQPMHSNSKPSIFEQTKHTCAKENVIMLDELVLSQQDQPQIYCSVHQVAQAGVIWIIFHGDLGLRCLNRRLLKSWQKHRRHSRYNCSKLLLIDVIFIWFGGTGKMLFPLTLQK